MRAAEIALAHYLGHLGLPSYPRPAVGPKFKRGAKFVLSPNFKQARPIFCSKKPKTSASQTETWSPPHPSDSPFILRGRQNYLSTSHKTPTSSVCHPIPPINRRPPPSRRSQYPDVVVQRNRNALKDLAAEAEAELPPRHRR